MPFLRRSAEKTVWIVALVALCLCILLLGVSVSASPAEATKEAYTFDASKLTYRRNGGTVAFYYDGEFDPAVVLCIVDEEKTVYPTSFGAEGITGTAALFVSRAEDDQYLTYSPEEPIIASLSENTAEEVAILPYGQKVTYDGTEYTYSIATPTTVSHVGTHSVTFAYETPVTVSFVIEQAIVNASADRYERHYLEEGAPSATGVTFSGDIVSEEDYEYIWEHLTLACPVQPDSRPNNYPITLSYDGSSSDF